MPGAGNLRDSVDTVDIFYYLHFYYLQIITIISQQSHSGVRKQKSNMVTQFFPSNSWVLVFNVSLSFEKHPVVCTLIGESLRNFIMTDLEEILRREIEGPKYTHHCKPSNLYSHTLQKGYAKSQQVADAQLCCA